MIAVSLSVISIGCGGSSGSTTSDGGSGDRAASGTAQVQRDAAYPVPSAPPKKGPLTKLVIRDLKVGKGPMAHWGDEVSVRYVGLEYQTAKMYSQHWNAPLLFKLDGVTFSKAWQEGIEGMRVGGRREVLVPSRLLFKDGDKAYLISLSDVES